MPTDPSLLLQGQPVQIQNPLEQYGRAVALRNALGQGQLQQQEIKKGQMELAGQQALNDAIQQNSSTGPDGSPVINHAGVVQALGSSGQGHLVPGYLSGAAALQKSQADAKKLQLENSASSLDLATRQFDAATDQPSWDHAIATAAGLGIDPAKQGIPAAYSPAAQATVRAMGMTVKEKLAAATAQLEAQTKASLAPAEVAKNTAAGRKDTAEAEKTEFQNTLMKTALSGGAGAGESLIQQRFAANPAAAQKAIAAWRQNLNNTGDLKTANEEVNKIYENEIGAPSKIAAETPAKLAQERQMIPIEASKAAARANAEIAPHVAQAVQTQAAIAKSAPDAYAAIPNPSRQKQAEDETDKVYKEYTDAVTKNQTFLNTVEGARTNPALVPLVGMQEVRAYLNRVTQSELNSVGSVGSMAQRAETWLSKNATGTPPKWLLDDISQIGKIQAQDAQSKFSAGKQRLQMRGVDVTKLPPPDTGTPAAAPAGGGWKVIKVE